MVGSGPADTSFNQAFTEVPVAGTGTGPSGQRSSLGGIDGGDRVPPLPAERLPGHEPSSSWTSSTGFAGRSW